MTDEGGTMVQVPWTLTRDSFGAQIQLPGCFCAELAGAGRLGILVMGCRCRANCGDQSLLQWWHALAGGTVDPIQRHLLIGSTSEPLMDCGRMWTESGPKGFEIQVCGCSKMFLRPAFLARHSVVHSTEKSYKCGGCDKELASHVKDKHAAKMMSPSGKSPS
eukprot:Polyplicarium_translucidae@DN3320_c3_g2_i5.p1